MHRELELLVLAYDSMLEAKGEEAIRATEIFESRLDDSLELHREFRARRLAGW